MADDRRKQLLKLVEKEFKAAVAAFLGIGIGDFKNFFPICDSGYSYYCYPPFVYSSL